MRRLDPQDVHKQIEQLKLAYPDLLDDEEAWGLALDSETDVNELIDRTEAGRQDDVAMVAGIKALRVEIDTRLKRYERREEVKRRMLFILLQWAGLQKVTLPRATISIRDGGEKLVIPDESAVPDDFCRIKREPQKLLIKEALKHTTFNWAHVEKNGPTLSVRTK
jgi:hypothetical protein